MTNHPTSAVIVAGGKSRRMGQDKRRLRFWGPTGPTLLEYTVALLGSLCAEVIVVLNDAPEWPELPARLVPDAYPNGGALGGLASGLAAAQYHYALAVAGDMPLLNTSLLAAMLALPRNYDVLIARVAPEDEPSGQKGPRNRLNVEPLHAIYSQACLAPMQNSLLAGRYQLISFFDAVRVSYLDPALIATHDPANHSFLSINTPEQVEQVRQILLTLDA